MLLKDMQSVNNNDDMIIMAIFIILLAISIVASNNFGDAINLIITLCLFVEDAFNLFLSEGDKPKNAISDPEIKPDPINRKKQEIKGIRKL